MGYIYKITNNINGNVYIGQTTGTIEKRFNEHKRDAIKGCQYALHRAMRKYGIDNFSIEEIEECLAEELNDREIYWISFYDSYYQGYNMTIGGSAFSMVIFGHMYNSLEVMPMSIWVISDSH